MVIYYRVVRRIDMTIDTDDLLNSILASIDRIHNVKSDEMPNIDLYMDQVTTFMEEKLKHATRNPEEDKVLTKTMINNYAKNDLLPPPVNKKYTKEHLAVLIFIFYSKGIMSIQDIQNMLTPLTERYFNNKDGMNLCQIYDEVFSLEKERASDIKKDIADKYAKAKDTFKDVSEDDQEILQLFSFIFMLGYDVYTKQLLIEKLLDGYSKLNKKEESIKKAKKDKAAKGKNKE